MQKLTEQDLKNLIAVVDYETHKNLTICIVELSCGFKVVGKSACLNPKDFDSAIGAELAYKDAINQLWQLEGYAQLRLNEEGEQHG